MWICDLKYDAVVGAAPMLADCAWWSHYSAVACYSVSINTLHYSAVACYSASINTLHLCSSGAACAVKQQPPWQVVDGRHNDGFQVADAASCRAESEMQVLRAELGNQKHWEAGLEVRSETSPFLPYLAVYVSACWIADIAWCMAPKAAKPVQRRLKDRKMFVI